MTRRTGVSVVICSYTEARWQPLFVAVRSAHHQTVKPSQIIVVIDHCPALLRRARCDLATVAGLDDRRLLTIVENSGQRGLSDARNTGVHSARRSVVAFLDDDAIAEPTWLEHLCHHYRDPNVLGVGGQVVAAWEAGRPAWFPPEFDWVVGCSYRGLPSHPRAIRNLVGANMSFRRDALSSAGGFRPELGRIGAIPLGCEETELCIRLADRRHGAVLLYEPAAVVRHQVPTTRATWCYFRSRCYAEGLSKAAVRRVAGGGAALASERSYLVTTIPVGIIKALARGLRGRPAETAGAAAIVAGVAGTVYGYLVGRSRSQPAVAGGPALPGRAPVGAGRAASIASRSSARWGRPVGGQGIRPQRAALSALPAVASVGALPSALLLWTQTFGHVDLSRMSDLGLVSVLPLTFWAALAVLTAGFAVALTSSRPRPLLLVGYLLALIAILHATPTVVYGTLRYAWAWKHVGVIDHILRHGSVSGKINNELAAYQAWPGFFALNALLVKVAGFRSALSYASWAPFVFNLLAFGPLALIFRRFTTDHRLIWTALWFFSLGSWVGQDYFSPQAYNYFLYLVVLAICLRWYSSSGVSAVPPGPAGRAPVRPLRTQPARRAGLLLILGPMLVAIATSHQLTPFMLISALTSLVVFRRCLERVLPMVMVVLTLGWILYAARSFLASHLAYIAASIGRPDANTKANFINLSQASHGQALVAHVDRLLSAGLWTLGALGLWRRRKRRQVDLPLVLLALSPLPMLVANSYGGEMVFRVYLFSLPFVAFFAAASLFPSATVGRSWLSTLLVTMTAVAALAGFSFSYYGKERANYFSHREVDAASWLYAHAPSGSLIVGPTSDMPWAFKDVEHYDSYWFALDLADGRKKLLADPAGVLTAIMTSPRHRQSYLILTRAQAARVDAVGLMPAGSVTRIKQTVVASRRFQVVFHNADVDILVAVSDGRAS